MQSMRFLLCSLLLLLPFGLRADDSPTASPTMTYVDTAGVTQEATSYDGSAPFVATFAANAENVGSYTPLYEWRFTRSGEATPFLLRYAESTQYEFKESGTYEVTLYISFVLGSDTVEYALDSPFSITISESVLEVPNAFSPNGDGINDVFRVKDSYQSIVSFEAKIFNRWGKKLYEWKDPAGGWDGTVGGSKAADGAYYLIIKARGADGRNYNIKKVINLLRGYTETSGS